MKENAAPAIPAIIDVLQEGLVNETTLQPLMETLVNNPEAAKAVVPLLKNEFEWGPTNSNDDLGRRAYVAGALMQLDPNHTEAYTFILDIVRGVYDVRHYDRLQAVKALLKLGRRDPAAVRICKKLVADGEAGIFEKQLVNRAQFTDYSVVQIPLYADAVLARIDPTDDFTSARIERHIGILMTELDVDTLIELMRPNAMYYRKRLANFSFPKSHSAWTPTTEYVELVVALGCFDEIAEYIERDLQDLKLSYMKSTEDILPLLTPYHQRLTPIVIKLLEDDDRYIRRRATGVLGIISEGNPEAIAGLLRALRDPYPTIRSRAADALGDMATTDIKIRNALQAALNDDYLCVRAAAERALGPITVPGQK
ncbi:MAG: HEAT repeat domain-containing protein [Planctomycetota bacterium]|nr:HEAT repeat domain-containing protein [Planctomycetota bacterium]